MDVAQLAAEMMSQCLAEGQAARTVASDDDAAAVRQSLRESARSRRVRVRTARRESAVVVARVDAAVWTDDAATMRAKLTLTPSGEVDSADSAPLGPDEPAR